MPNRAVAPEKPPSPTLVPFDAEYDIGLVLAFLNTYDAQTGDDLLTDPERWRRWCAERRLGVTTDADAAREIRDTVRSSVMYGKPTAVRPRQSWPMRVTLSAGVPLLAGTDAVGAVLASSVHLVTIGQWDRIKICPADDCLLAFYDRSRNRSRTWCSMRVCGNREKARSWRERHAATGAG